MDLQELERRYRAIETRTDNTLEEVRGLKITAAIILAVAIADFLFGVLVG